MTALPEARFQFKRDFSELSVAPLSVQYLANYPNE
jgi:hypothetical protein